MCLCCSPLASGRNSAIKCFFSSGPQAGPNWYPEDQSCTCSVSSHWSVVDQVQSLRRSLKSSTITPVSTVNCYWVEAWYGELAINCPWSDVKVEIPFKNQKLMLLYKIMVGTCCVPQVTHLNVHVKDEKKSQNWHVVQTVHTRPFSLSPNDWKRGQGYNKAS